MALPVGSNGCVPIHPLGAIESKRVAVALMADLIDWNKVLIEIRREQAKRLAEMVGSFRIQT